MNRSAIRALAAAIAAMAAAALLSACASTDTATGAATIVAASTPEADATEVEKDFHTGSRIPKKSTDRMIRRTDNTGAKEMARDMPPNPGPAFH
jgi:type IV pilus biogenesis protein CpaD/CtpE